MKLLTIKQMKNGLYRDIDLDTTITAMIMKNYLPLSAVCYAIYIFSFQPSPKMAATVMLLFFLSYILMYPIGYYFMCCETYISEGDGNEYNKI